MQNILLEICCGSVEDIMEAEKGGADRVELNSAVFLGGLTPSAGTIIEAKKKASIPVMVMIRPRPGGFCYTDEEYRCMENDVKIALDYGADGIVFGILNRNGNVDLKRCEKLIKIAEGKDIVFHRAFDIVPDAFKAMEQLIDIGVTRILTSGQKKTVYEGEQLIKRLIQCSNSRIEILPGGGVRSYYIKEFISRTGCNQLHMGCFKDKIDDSVPGQSNIHFGGALYYNENTYCITDSAGVFDFQHKIRLTENR